MNEIRLFWLVDEANSPASPDWSPGPTVVAGRNPRSLARATADLPVSADEWWLFWDARFGPPSADRVREILETPGEVFHGGLLLGQGGRPDAMDSVHPTWMLQRDAPADRPASSWRVSLRACLLRAHLWHRLGGVDDIFDDLDAASLEFGHRWWRGGALLRHQPSLLEGVPTPESAPVPSPLDEMRILRRVTGRFWCAWATGRSLRTLERKIPRLRAFWATRKLQMPPAPEKLRSNKTSSEHGSETVAVLIPTLDRYPYLRVVLDQLRDQTVPPAEIVVIDQTPPAKRPAGWQEAFADLPLRVIERDVPGQSSARNAGLVTLRSERVLFLDDDVEIEPDLVARHLETLHRFRADASCGVTEEKGAGPLPEGFRRRRLSDVFPTCNAMIRREVLHRSGLFDLAFDHGSRADADLGTRIYLAGGLMVLDPSISVVHHKAPSGGLREHGARVVTYADSRRRLWARHLPSATEIYLAERYFTPRQVREALWIRTAGTLKGGRGKTGRAVKLILGLVQWPHTLWRVRRARRRAEELLERYPRIPRLPERKDTE